MQEGLSYIASAQLPCVVVNVVRGGPGLGTIQPSQGDYFQAVKGGGHGDYHLIVLAPASVQEMADFVFDGFRSEPVFISVPEFNRYRHRSRYRKHTGASNR